MKSYETHELNIDKTEAINILAEAMAELAKDEGLAYVVDIRIRRVASMPKAKRKDQWEANVSVKDLQPTDRIRFVYAGGTEPGETRDVEVYTYDPKHDMVRGWDIQRNEIRCFKRDRINLLRRMIPTESHAE
jgi:predicted DNA-binding transcriptional regulator YafY